MKILIDIDEDLFNKVKTHVEESGPICSDVWIAVANGKPYEVRPFCEFKFDKDQLKELVDGAIDEYLRKQEFADFGPHGEWIIEHLPKNINNPNDCYECVSCSECGFHYDYMFRECNYCPNCGADMRGEKNDYSET